MVIAFQASEFCKTFNWHLRCNDTTCSNVSRILMSYACSAYLIAFVKTWSIRFSAIVGHTANDMTVDHCSKLLKGTGGDRIHI